jgi:hypothetical protein
MEYTTLLWSFALLLRMWIKYLLLCKSSEGVQFLVIYLYNDLHFRVGRAKFSALTGKMLSTPRLLRKYLVEGTIRRKYMYPDTFNTPVC